MPSIDVAVVCYLRDCVTSFTSQGVADLRVLIIDNGSTDDSLEVCARRDVARFTAVRSFPLTAAETPMLRYCMAAGGSGRSLNN